MVNILNVIIFQLIRLELLLIYNIKSADLVEFSHLSVLALFHKLNFQSISRFILH